MWRSDVAVKAVLIRQKVSLSRFPLGITLSHNICLYKHLLFVAFDCAVGWRPLKQIIHCLRPSLAHAEVVLDLDYMLPQPISRARLVASCPEFITTCKMTIKSAK